MVSLRTTSCCFCISTCNGCILIGIIQAVISGVLNCLLFHNPQKYYPGVPNANNSEQYPTSTYVCSAVYVANILTSCLLIYGAMMEKRHFLLPWLTCDIVTIGTVVTTTAMSFTTDIHDIATVVLDVIFKLYSFVVVFSHFSILKQDKSACKDANFQSIWVNPPEDPPSK